MIPFWRWVPAKWSHAMAPLGLRWYCALTSSAQRSEVLWTWRGLTFTSRVGLAGGVDKNAELLEVWPHLGFGFVEVGTVTPLAQAPNEGLILARDWQGRALWNKMGFPNDGAELVHERLQWHRVKYPVPIFVNIGKNRNSTGEQIIEDYRHCARQLRGVADTLVVNVSSPNTVGLRDLQSAKNLEPLLQAVVQEAQGVPVLVKLSPDEGSDGWRNCFDVAAKVGIAGFILTNTTVSREPNTKFPKEGGVSGQPLKKLAREALQTASQHFAGTTKPLLVSVGGILSVEEAKERLAMGADLVQIYTAMVLNGPQFPRQLSQGLEAGK